MTWTEIETVTLGSAAASISFSTGLSTYKFFRLTIYLVNDANAGACTLTFNADTGANYAKQRISANGATVAGARATGQTGINLGGFNLSANDPFNGTVIVAKPAAGVKGQTIAQTSLEDSANIVMDVNGAEWDNTADVISSMVLTKSSGNFAAGTTFLLEGLSY